MIEGYEMDYKVKDKWLRIKYLVIDVDGTMTDAGIYYDENGNELKKFCTKDAAGFFVRECALQCVHRSACHGSRLILCAVFDSQHAFCKFCGESDQG